MSLKVLTMPRTRIIFRRMHTKSRQLTLTKSSRGSSVCLASNNTLLISPSGPGSTRKYLPEEKFDDELPAGIGDDSTFYVLVIDGELQIGGVSGGKFSTNSHNLSQQYFCLKNDDVSCENGFIKIHTLSQCN